MHPAAAPAHQLQVPPSRQRSCRAASERGWPGGSAGTTAAAAGSGGGLGQLKVRHARQHRRDAYGRPNVGHGARRREASGHRPCAVRRHSAWAEPPRRQRQLGRQLKALLRVQEAEAAAARGAGLASGHRRKPAARGGDIPGDTEPLSRQPLAKLRSTSCDTSTPPLRLPARLARGKSGALGTVGASLARTSTACTRSSCRFYRAVPRPLTAPPVPAEAMGPAGRPRPLVDSRGGGGRARGRLGAVAEPPARSAWPGARPTRRRVPPPWAASAEPLAVGHRPTATRHCGLEHTGSARAGARAAAGAGDGRVAGA